MERVTDDQLEYLPTEQVRERLETLSPADLRRVEQISSYLTRSATEAEDLRHEAYLRLLDGSRRCRVDQALVHCLAGAMKSIQSARYKAAVRALRHEEQLALEPALIHGRAPQGPLEELLTQETEFQVSMGFLRLFGDDPVAMTVLEGIMEGFQGSELCELAGISPAELATKRRLIKRRLDGAGGLRR